MRKVMVLAAIVITFLVPTLYLKSVSSYANQQFNYLKAVVTEQYMPGYLSYYDSKRIDSYCANDIKFMREWIADSKDLVNTQSPREIAGYLKRLRPYQRIFTQEQKDFIDSVPKHMESREARWAQVIQAMEDRLTYLNAREAGFFEALWLHDRTITALSDTFNEIIGSNRYVPNSEETLKSVKQEADIGRAQTAALLEDAQSPDLRYDPKSEACMKIREVVLKYDELLKEMEPFLDVSQSMQVFPPESINSADDADYTMVAIMLDEALDFRHKFRTGFDNGTLTAKDVVDARLILTGLQGISSCLLSDSPACDCWDELALAFIELEKYFSETIMQIDKDAGDIIAEHLGYLDKLDNALTVAMEARDRGDTKGVVMTLDNILADGLVLVEEFYAADDLMDASNTLPDKAVLRTNMCERYLRLFSACDCLYDGKPVMTR